MADITFTPEPGSISPPLDLLTKDINPQAREILDARSPMSQFREVEPNLVDAGGAKQIDMNARARLGGFRSPMSQFKEVEGRTLPGFKEADDFDVKSVEELVANRKGFDPVSYFDSHPDLPRNPKDLQKILEIYRQRDEEGLTAKVVIDAAVKNTPGILEETGGGIKRFGERAIDVTVQPIANVVLGTFSGDLFDDQKRAALFNETRKIIRKGSGEGSAGSEAATMGFVDLGRTGLRKAENQPGNVGDDLPGTRVSRPKLPPPKPKTDQELLAQIADDAAFRKNAEDIAKGEGEFAKSVGLDKETLAKEGIELDTDAIRQLSLVDPVSMIAVGGLFKLVGAGGRVLATARTVEGIQQTADKISKVAKFTGKVVERTGREIAKTKELGGLKTTILGTAIGGPTGTIIGAGVSRIAGPIVRPLIRKTGPSITQAGKIIAGEVPLAEGSASAQRLANIVNKGVVAPIEAGTQVFRAAAEGAGKGFVAGAPLAVLSDDDVTAGSLLGAGTALGGLHGVGAKGVTVLKDATALRYFGEKRPTLPELSSPDYGTPDDAVHEANKSKLSVQDATELNYFREAFRSQKGEMYAVDRGTFRQKVANEYRSRTGQELSQGQLDIYENHQAFFDEMQGDKKVVYLNADAKGRVRGAVHHDAGHIFDALLSEDTRKKLRAAVDETYTPEELEARKKNYQDRVGNEIGPDSAKDEFIADQFSALFNGVPLSELAAPRGLLNTFIDVIAEGAEALGVDFKGTTPTLGDPTTIALQNLFRRAAGEVLKKPGEIPPGGSEPTNVTPLPPTEPSSGVPPTAPPTNVVPLTPPPPAPANVVPLRPEARPIRPSGTDLPAPVTPEARAAAAARFAETGIEQARLNAKSDPVIARAVDDVSTHMEAGNPVLEINHLGVVSEGTPDSPEGRTSRRATQAAGYEALKGELSRAGAPADLVASHLKTFVPVRWTQQGGTPTLIAMSLDKALQNIRKLGSDPKAASLIPYPTENGNLTAQGWRDAVSDLRAYAENQANGRRGDGGRLTVPEAGELSIPTENPSYTPQPLSPEKADFANVIQGLDTPVTAREVKGKTPGNVKGQLLAEANKRPLLTPSDIKLKNLSKQTFKSGRSLKEVNPLRNRLKEAGATSVGELIEVTERIRAVDIEKVTPRPDINFKAPVTDIIRGGFLPAPTEFRQKNLGGRTVEEFSDYILKAAPEEWKAATENMTGGLTGGAWNLGLGLKDAGDVSILKSFQDKLSDATKAAMQSGDFDAAYSLVSKGQFFREAYEAATGTGSAGAAFKRGQMGTEGVKPPFPEEKTQGTAAAGPETKPVNVGEGGQFLPAEQLDLGTSESSPPELRVLPAAPGGRPPTEPPGFRPPPVAAGFQPAEELQPEEIAPGVRVLPAASGAGTPPTGPTFRPPPIAAGFLPKEDEKKQLNGTAFKDFFSKVTKGEFGKSDVPWVPVRDITKSKDFLDAVKQHSGNFDEHIAKSIPGYRETQMQKGDAIVKTYPEGARVLDIGGSEGAWNKAISQKSEGKIETVVADPNPDMAAFFRTKSQVPGSTYSESAWIHGFDDNGKQIPAFDDKKRFDVINESMVFQFISTERAEQVGEAKRLLKPDGIFLSDEKLRTEQWKANEAKKDKDYKAVYFSDADLKAKDQVVGFQQAKSETKAVGMIDNMVPETDYETTLKNNFKHVVQYWDSGNFKGYAASDDLLALGNFLNNLGDTKTEFSTVETPRIVEGSANFQPRTESGRKLEEKGYEIVASGELGIRKVTIKDKDGADIAQIQSIQRSPKRAEIAFVNKIKGAPAGLGEVLYRELGAQLKEDGVTEVGGNVVSPEPLAIRRKVFGDFASLDLNGEPATFDQAIAASERIQARTENEVAAIEPVNTISEASRFLPKVKRDAQGRPLDKEGNIDYAKWQKEGLAARRKQEKEPIAESTPRGTVSKDAGPITGWILPDKNFVPLDANFHEQYLANNSQALNDKFKTNFSDVASVDDRLDALNAGFVRLRNQNGQLRVEVNAGKFPSVKSKLLNVLQDREAQIDGLTVSLLNDKGIEVDSTSAARLHELSGPEKFDKISEAIDTLRGGRFLPTDESLPGFKSENAPESPEQFLKEKTARVRKDNPEAILPQYTHDASGKLSLGSNGKPKPVAIEYDFASTPFVKAGVKGLKGEARNAKAAEVLGDELVKVYNKAIKNPDIEAGSKWYSTARTRLKKLLGDDSKLFAELLGATSARTAVDVNFGFALEAYNQFKSGAFDDILTKYREGKQTFDQGDIAAFVKDTSNAEPNRGQYLSWWIDKHDLTPLQSNGKKFGMNSIPVLKVLDGSWASEVKGPKTPNFTGNLTGESFEATVDIWAARMLHRLGNKGNEGRWRILPENETGVTDQDFYLGQAAFRHAAEKLKVKPDSLQAILWFAEKDYYEKQGWTRSVGAAKSDFNVLLKRTERTPSGKLKLSSAQKELDIEQGTLDITPKNK